MKFPSNLRMAVLALLLAPGWALGESPEDLFTVVPAGDATYSQLAQLEKMGWLSGGNSKKILTRFEVAELILKAREREQIVVAQADEIPPPPGDDTASPASSTEAPATAPAAVPAASAPSETVNASDEAEAEKNLKTLSEAYQFELEEVKDKVKSVENHSAALDSAQYDLMKRLNGILEYPTVAFHGLGRAFAVSRQLYGNFSLVTPEPADYITGSGYLDLQPFGSISKQVRWNALLRFGTSFQPDVSTDFFLFRRITLELNPDWFSATIGDFDEAYTPLTLWNRNSLDLFYKPEMMARMDDTAKYESFFNEEPDWPFRGLRIGTEIMWPDSSLLETFKTSVFANMIANGFSADAKNGSFFGPTNFTDWIFAGEAGLKSRKLYLGGMTVQLGVDIHGVVLDQPLNTDTPKAIYNQFDPTTWAHQYLVGSWTPDLRIGFGGDFYLGGSADLALSSYQDDKQDNMKILKDYAVIGGPYLRMGDSKVTFNFLDVGPSYYSPLAQTRQDGVTSVGNSFTFALSPALFQEPIRSQYFLTDIPRPDGIFSFYDRTRDNTFPYGLATPNRQGIGGELEVKTLEKKALKIMGSAYFVKEISDNLVPNVTDTGLTPVDSPATVLATSGYAQINPAPALVTLTRKFTYVNFGPSLNIGPLIGWDRDLEIGADARYEQTTSSIGTLNSLLLLGGIRVGVLPSWDLSAAYSVRTAKGTEVGYLGTLYARYPYLYEDSSSKNLNADLGKYDLINIDGNIQNLEFSSVFKVNRNSSFYLDYDFTYGNMLPSSPVGILYNQFMELTYEIEF